MNPPPELPSGQLIVSQSPRSGLPLAAGNGPVAFIAMIGGLSAATAMVVVESVALSIMASNNLVLPLLLRAGRGLGGV